MSNVVQPVGRLAVGLAAALLIVTVAIAPLLTPTWLAFEQDRAGAAARTGFAEPDLRAVTDAILADLVLGPPDFDVEVAGAPVLNARERGHMRDVRSVFIALWVAAAISIVLLVIAARRMSRVGLWQSVGRAAFSLAVATVGLGVVALVAFDALFTVFHQVFFSPGSFAFDPATDRLVQLFPFQFWQESAMAAGVLIVGLAAGVGLIAWRRQWQPAPHPIRDSSPTRPGPDE